MASLKDVQLKIIGVGKTKQITKAMNTVSSAKLRGAQQRAERFRPYANKFHEILGELSSKADSVSHPLLEVHGTPTKVAIILVTSDRGLCGGFNINLISSALKLAKTKKAAGMEISFYCIGRKGRDAARKQGYKLAQGFETQASTSADYSVVMRLGETLINEYTAGNLDEVHLVYSEFVNVLSQPVHVLGILPMAEPEGSNLAGNSQGQEYIYEPEAGVLLSKLLPRYVNVQIYRGLLDTVTSEHAARMAAMDNATRNCDEITDNLTLLFNKTRQASITTELMDIVSGAEALNG